MTNRGYHAAEQNIVNQTYGTKHKILHKPTTGYELIQLMNNEPFKISIEEIGK